MHVRSAIPNQLSGIFFAALASVLCVPTANAHIELLEPIARYPLSISGANKACPCGVGESNRLCDVPGDRSDDDRSTDRVTTLVAGTTVTFRFDEYVAHGGRYRVAIDYEGADLADFNANVLVDIPDPGGNVGNIGNGSLWEIEVPLPDQACDNCTIQLIQMMDGDMSAPVTDPIGRSSYYTCADVILLASEGGASAAGSGGGPTSAAGGASSAGGGATIGAGGGNPGANDDDGPGLFPNQTASGCQVGGSSGPEDTLFALLGALFAATRRRRSSSRTRS